MNCHEGILSQKPMMNFSTGAIVLSLDEK